MAITTAMANSFKVQLMQAVHDFTATGGDVIKLALYTSTATLDKSTTVYTTTNEAVGTGYTAGGAALVKVEPVLSVDSAVMDFNDLVFSTVTITARGCLIYNQSQQQKAISSHDFGADKTATAGNFTIQFPAAAAGTAVLELA